MAWWSIRGHDREVSRSMVALVLTVLAAALLGVTAWLPDALRDDSGLHSVTPSRLIVEADAIGTATLGDGYTVTLSPAGFRYARSDVLMADTVTRGAPVVAVLGSAATTTDDGRERVHEQIDDTLARATFTALEVHRTGAVWTGRVEGEVGGRHTVLPVRWSVSLVGDRIHTSIEVPGADAVVVALDRQPATTGLPPALPDRNLRSRAHWVTRGSAPERVFTWVLGTDVGLGPATVARGVDLTVDGRIDLHAWASTVDLFVSGQPVPRTG